MPSSELWQQAQSDRRPKGGDPKGAARGAPRRTPPSQRIPRGDRRRSSDAHGERCSGDHHQRHQDRHDERDGHRDVGLAGRVAADRDAGPHRVPRATWGGLGWSRYSPKPNASPKIVRNKSACGGGYGGVRGGGKSPESNRTQGGLAASYRPGAPAGGARTSGGAGVLRTAGPPTTPAGRQTRPASSPSSGLLALSRTGGSPRRARAAAGKRGDSIPIRMHDPSCGARQLERRCLEPRRAARAMASARGPRSCRAERALISQLLG